MKRSRRQENPEESAMELTVLTVPDCPNAALLAERLVAVGVAQDQVVWTTVTSDEQAAKAGMHGSPTLLLDGVDPFAEPGAPTGYACRLYRGPGGAVDGAPTAAALAGVLAGGPVAAPTTLTLSV
jgi:hypothetical protein